MNDQVSIEIREAKIDDLPSIFHLGEKLFTPQKVSNLYRTWDEYEVTRLFNSEPENMLVAEKENHIVGFALGTIIEKARSAWTYGHLLWLGTDPEAGRKGVGGMLFDKFCDIMKKKGARILMVDTQADNEPAINFFKNKGFENPTDHVYMTLNLQKEN